MVEETAFKNGRISNYQGLVTLTLDQVILHTIVHHSSTSTYMPNFTEIKENFFVGKETNGWTFETGLIRSTLKRLPKNRIYLLINVIL